MGNGYASVDNPGGAMRFFLLLLALSLQAAVVDKGGGSSPNTTDAASVTLTGCASANRAIVVAHYNAQQYAGFTISNTSGASWNPPVIRGVDVGGINYYYTDIVTFSSSETFTVTPSGGLPGVAIIAVCFTSSAGAPTVSAGASSGLTTVNSLQAGSVTPFTGGDVLASTMVWAAPADPSIDEGFSVIQSSTGTANGQKGWVANLTAPSTSAVNPTWSYVAGPHYAVALTMAFPAPATGSQTARIIE